tara:strand:- start:379 stop:873 length:495 start_codon:yes stop_codon:yes gene_type:complete
MSTLRVDNLRGQTADGKDRYVTQVKQFVLATADSITSTSFIDSSVTLNITPSSVTNKIRVTINGYFGQNFWHATPYFRIRRDSTQISFNEGSHWPRVQYDSTRDSESGLSLVMDILDSPATTSSVTYTLQSRTSNSSYPLYLNRTIAVAGPMAQTTLTLMEIAQ